MQTTREVRHWYTARGLSFSPYAARHLPCSYVTANASQNNKQYSSNQSRASFSLSLPSTHLAAVPQANKKHKHKGKKKHTTVTPTPTTSSQSEVLPQAAQDYLAGPDKYPIDDSARFRVSVPANKPVKLGLSPLSGLNDYHTGTYITAFRQMVGIIIASKVQDDYLVMWVGGEDKNGGRYITKVRLGNVADLQLDGIVEHVNGPYLDDYQYTRTDTLRMSDMPQVLSRLEGKIVILTFEGLTTSGIDPARDQKSAKFYREVSPQVNSAVNLTTYLERVQDMTVDQMDGFLKQNMVDIISYGTHAISKSGKMERLPFVAAITVMPGIGVWFVRWSPLRPTMDGKTASRCLKSTARG